MGKIPKEEEDQTRIVGSDQTRIIDEDKTRVFIPGGSALVPVESVEIKSKEPPPLKPKKEIIRASTRRTLLIGLLCFMLIDLLQEKPKPKISDVITDVFLLPGPNKVSNPEAAKAAAFQGKLAYQVMDLDSALIASRRFLEAVELNPQEPSYKIQLALAYMGLDPSDVKSDNSFYVIGKLLGSPNVVGLTPEYMAARLRFDLMIDPSAASRIFDFAKGLPQRSHPDFYQLLFDLHYILGTKDGLVDLSKEVYSQFGGSKNYRLLVSLGRSYEQLGRFDQAVEIYNGILKDKPGHLESWLGMARVALQKKSFESLRKILHGNLEKSLNKLSRKKQSEYYTLLSYDLWIRKQPSEEIKKALSYAIRLDPWQPRARMTHSALVNNRPIPAWGDYDLYMSRIISLKRTGKQSTLQTEILLARNFIGNLPLFTMWMAELYELEDRKNEAAEWWNKLVQENRGYWPIVSTAASRLAKLGDVDSASRIKEEFRKEYSSHFRYQYLEAAVARALGGGNEGYLRAAASRVSGFAQAESDLGDIYVSVGNWKLAKNQFDLAINWDPSEIKYYIKAARALGNIGSPGDAIEFLEKRRQFFGEEPRFYALVADVALDVGDTNRALELVEKVRSEDQNYKYFLTKAEISIKKDLLGEASTLLKQCLTVQPRYLRCMIRLAEIQEAQGSEELALITYKDVLSIDRKYPGIYARIAKIYRRFGDRDGALGAAKQELQYYPKSADALAVIGAVYRDAKNVQEAYQIFSRALEIAPNHYESLVGMGDLQRDMGGLENSLATLRNAMRVHRDRPEAYISIIKTYNTIGDQVQARQFYQELIKIRAAYADDPTILKAK